MIGLMVSAVSAFILFLMFFNAHRIKFENHAVFLMTICLASFASISMSAGIIYFSWSLL